MLKVLLPVDGSKSAVRATKALVKTLAWYKSSPQIDLLAVHLPVPRLHNMGLVVSKQMLERYYAEESAVMLAPSEKILEAAKVKYTVHTAVGSIAETIIDRGETIRQRHDLHGNARHDRARQHGVGVRRDQSAAPGAHPGRAYPLKLTSWRISHACP